MKTFNALACLLASCGTLLAAPFYGIKDQTMGEYEGVWTAANGARGRVTAQVRPLSNNRYDGFILFYRARSPVAAFNLKPGLLENQRISFGAVTSTQPEGGDLLAKTEAVCSFENGKLAGTFKGDLGEGKFEATKTERKSPTLEAKPPAGAIVLFGDKPSAAWENFSWAVQDGVATVGRGSMKAKLENAPKDYKLHVEFRTPFMPVETGQARGNSGVYVQGRYEVQVLDSFGLFPLRDNDCAGIYSVKAPRMNACLPPMEWQTYDITFLSEGPRLTVNHNGVTVIDNVQVAPRTAQRGTGGGDTNAVFLLLQDHGNPVQYRNIWVEPLKK